MGLKQINKHLKNVYGCHLDGRPRFRLAFTDQIEKRWGTFQIYTGNLFLREHHGMMELPKYPAKDQKERWVLEQLVFAPGMVTSGLVEGQNGSYEPLYVFPKDDEGNPLQPTTRALDFLLHTLRYGKKRTMSDFVEEEEEAEKKALAKDLEILDNESPYLATMLHNREAIVVPGKVVLTDG